jgi:hypothetical protein
MTVRVWTTDNPDREWLHLGVLRTGYYNDTFTVVTNEEVCSYPVVNIIRIKESQGVKP